MVTIAAAGDNVVDCYEFLGQMYPGGNALNVAVFARRNGASASYLGAVGTDTAGKLIRSALRAEGVNLERLRVRPGMTAFCVIGHRHGDRVFLRSDVGVSRFELDTLDLRFIARHDAVHVSQSSGLDHRLEDLASLVPLSYDFSTRRDPEHIAAVAPHCFLASISGGDLTTEAADEIAAQALAAGARYVLVTRGADGAFLTHAGGTTRVGAAPRTVVDTLGAGDTFIARVLVGLVAEEKPDAVMADAARRAADTCGSSGAFGYGLPLEAAAQGNIPEPQPENVRRRPVHPHRLHAMHTLSHRQGAPND
jgi:fructoselysine 6-kinase